MDRVGFWHTGFAQLILSCVLTKLGRLQNKVLPSGTFSQTLDIDFH